MVRPLDDYFGQSATTSDCTVTADAQMLGNAEGRRGGDGQVILVCTEHIMGPL